MIELSSPADHVEFDAGVQRFNRGAYFDAHEAWEVIWRRTAAGDTRTLLQGLIQAAAALHKLFDREEPASAQRLLARALAKLDPLPAAAAGMRLAALREGLRGVATELATGQGPARIQPPTIRRLDDDPGDGAD